MEVNGLRVHLVSSKGTLAYCWRLLKMSGGNFEFLGQQYCLVSGGRVITGLLTILLKHVQHLKFFTLKVFVAHSCNAL